MFPALASEMRRFGWSRAGGGGQGAGQSAGGCPGRAGGGCRESRKGQVASPQTRRPPGHPLTWKQLPWNRKCWADCVLTWCPGWQPLTARRWGAGAPASWGGVCHRAWAFWPWSRPVFWEALGTPRRYCVISDRGSACVSLPGHGPLRGTFRQPETQTCFLPETFTHRGTEPLPAYRHVTWFLNRSQIETLKVWDNQTAEKHGS